MTHSRFIAIAIFIIISIHSIAQNKITRKEYISRFKEIAVKEMLRSGIPASITMAQACLESDNGNSELARESNNHFGIKCKTDWMGARSYHNDDKQNECFRKYRTAEESYDDHTNFLTQNQRYAFLFKISHKDYDAWAKGLRTAGYATDPEYANRLIKIIVEEQLHQLDLMKADDLPQHDIIAEKGIRFNPEESRKKAHRKADSNRKFDDMSLNPYNQREIKNLNGLDIIYVKEGDTYESIAQEFDMDEWEILNYNDLPKDAPQPKANDFLYLETKGFRAQKGKEKHVVMPQESMWSISQLYGIRLNRLYKLNRIKKDERPVVGDPLNLREKIKREKK